MRLACITVDRFKIEIELAQVLRFQPIRLQLDCHQTVLAPVDEQYVGREISFTHLRRELRAHEEEVAPKLEEKVA